MKLFAAQRFEEACERFHLVAAGPDAQIADKARSYFQICERKTGNRIPEFSTAEEHFTYGVERMNARDMEPARLHLEKALRLEPEGDHILYTMALCDGLSGDGEAACENLKRAISLEPRNRILARQDPEFAGLVHRFPALRALLASDAA
jgi:tetratricopeptide (TPR) repeat protein